MKEDKPPNKGQADLKHSCIHTVCRKSPLKEDNSTSLQRTKRPFPKVSLNKFIAPEVPLYYNGTLLVPKVWDHADGVQ